MAAPKGNKNAYGYSKKGIAGRKSSYYEKANAEFLRKAFFEAHTREEMREKLTQGKLSLMEVLVGRAYSGDTKALLAIFNKVFPDRLITKEEDQSVKHYFILD